MLTDQIYSYFSKAYVFFNKQLFGQQLLPEVLLSFTEKKRSYGFFCRQGVHINGSKMTYHYIALNPFLFDQRTDEEILSTLVHEMVHCWQQEHGANIPEKPWHNREWAAKMMDVGLMPSGTGHPGGKKTGAKISHFILDNGLFQEVAPQFLAKHGSITFHGVLEEIPRVQQEKKYKFFCLKCPQKAWAYEDASLLCGDCREPLHRTMDQIPMAMASG